MERGGELRRVSHRDRLSARPQHGDFKGTNLVEAATLRRRRLRQDTGTVRTKYKQGHDPQVRKCLFTNLLYLMRPFTRELLLDSLIHFSSNFMLHCDFAKFAFEL